MKSRKTVFRIVAEERARRNVEIRLEKVLRELKKELSNIEELVIHKKYIQNKDKDMVKHLSQVYQKAYEIELEEKYKNTPHSIVKKICSNDVEILYRYILVWYKSNNKEIEFRGFRNYKDAEKKIIELLVIDKIDIDKIYLVEDIETMIDVDAVIENEIDKFIRPKIQ